MEPMRDSHWDESVDRPWAGKAEAVGRRLLYNLGAAFLGGAPAQPFNIHSVKKILLIKEPYRMGDLFQITPTLRALKVWKPDLQIGLVIQERNLPIFESNPHLTRIHAYRKRVLNRAPWKIFSFFAEIRRAKYDLAVTLETQRIHLTNDLIALFSGAPHRLRYDGGAFGNPESNAFYNLLTPFKAGAEHQVDKNFEVFAPYGLSMNDRTLEFAVPATSLSGADLCIHPGSFKVAKRWLLPNYLDAARAQRDKGKSVVFILGPSELDWQGKIEEAGVRAVTKISLAEMAALFKKCGRVLCNDTGVMHIAGAVGAKTLALFGQTEPGEWKPPGEAVSYLRAPDKNIASISINEVLKNL